MFGYININRKKLSEDDLNAYRSYYCGLCQTLKKNYGAKGQLLLNYDMTFLIVFLTGLYEPEVEVESRFICKMHPTKKRTAKTNQITEYAAALNVMLAYYNLVDDYQDDGKISRKAMAKALEKSYLKAKEKYPRQARSIEYYIDKLNEYEAKSETNIDTISALTGNMLGDLFAYKEDEWYDELKKFGFFIGKFIYIMDAYEDIEKDIKKKSFNPLIHLKNSDADKFDDTCEMILSSMISNAAKVFERLPILTHADIIRNILYCGVWSKFEQISGKKNKRKKDEEE